MKAKTIDKIAEKGTRLGQLSESKEAKHVWNGTRESELSGKPLE